MSASRRDITAERLLSRVTWEWQEVEELMPELMGTVAPGKALRTYMNRQGKHLKGTGNKAPLTEDEKITSGRRAIANDRISAQVEGGRMEVKRDDEGRRWVRFRERRDVADARGNCPTCNRPFTQASEEKDPAPTPERQRVIYPSFPSWEKESQRKMGAL